VGPPLNAVTAAAAAEESAADSVQLSEKVVLEETGMVAEPVPLPLGPHPAGAPLVKA
jgi:hypothetical protein